MKTKFTLLMLLASSLFPMASAADNVVQQLPEPSILGLFAAAAIGFTAIKKFKK